VQSFGGGKHFIPYFFSIKNNIRRGIRIQMLASSVKSKNLLGGVQNNKTL